MKTFDPLLKDFLQSELNQLNKDWDSGNINSIQQKRAGFIQQVLLILNADKTAIWVKSDFSDIFSKWKNDIFDNCFKNGVKSQHIHHLQYVESLRNRFCNKN